MTLKKEDMKRAADIRREVAEFKKLRKIPPVLPHLATALQTPSPIWGARPVEKPQLQSKLMTLPAELRNLIVSLSTFREGHSAYNDIVHLHSRPWTDGAYFTERQ